MPDNPHAIQELEAPDHLLHHQGEWVAERIGWLLIVTILVAATSGLLGRGWLSNRELVSDDQTLAVEYDGIGRNLSPAVLKLRVVKSGGRSAGILDAEVPEFHLALPRSFIDATVIEHVVPEPIAMELGPDAVVYTFHAAHPDENPTVIFHYQYQKFGSFTHPIRLVGKEPAEVRQWILP